MNKEFHHIEDIFGKSHFVKWDLDEDNVRHLFGEEWANNHPGKFRMLDHTVEILKAMEDEAVEWEPENQNRVWAAIQKKMDHGTVSAPHGQRLISAASSYKSSSQFSGLKVVAILAMVRELERWYGVDITFQGAVPHDQKVSGEFRQDHLDNVLKSLSYSFGFAYHIEHKKVSIQFKEYRNT